MDRRSRRTRIRLRDAMVSLVQEKPWDRIRVADILARADVGRATFYAHFRDKEDLLVSLYMGMIDFLETQADAQARGQSLAQGPTELLPVVRSLFRHFHEARDFGRALQRSDKIEMLLRAAEKRLQRSLEARLPAHDPDRAMAAGVAAGAFTTMVRIWMAEGARTPPDRMADLWEALVAPGLTDQSRWYGEPARMVTAR
jgi:AcrR family transcriptional regulator